MRWNEEWKKVTENGKTRSYRKMTISEEDRFQNSKGVIRVTGFNINVWQGSENDGATIETNADTTVKYHCYDSKTNHSIDLMGFLEKLSDEEFEWIG